MSENESKPPETMKEKAPAQSCTCNLVANDQGSWELKADSSPECVGTVETLANSLGPNARHYLAKHISPNGEAMEKAVNKLEGSKETTA